MPNFTIEIQIPAMERLAEALIGIAKNITSGTSNILASMSAPETSAAPVISQQSTNTYAPTTVPQQQPYPTAMPVNPTPAPHPVVSAVPNVAPVAPAPAFALDDLARAATQLVDTGRQQQIFALFRQFGLQALSQLPKERYGEFATALRQLGAKL